MSIRIVLVDDHQMMRDGLRAVLESREGIEVIGEAANGRDAIETVRRLAPHVVVMDIGMAEMNGIEATRRLVADDPALKVVALSVFSDRRYVLNMLEAGALAYVPKASAHDELLRAIDAVMKGDHYLSPEITGIVVETARKPDAALPAGAYKELGAREREVLQLLAEGKTSGEIAMVLGVSARTVETHRRNIMQKLDLHSVAELTKYAIREGLTNLEA